MFWADQGQINSKSHHKTCSFSLKWKRLTWGHGQFDKLDGRS